MVFILGILVLSGLLSANMHGTKSNPGDEQCILCHVISYNTALKKQSIHLPFFERRCSVCHLAEQLAPTDDYSQDTGIISGRLVDQSVLWRKALNFEGKATGGTHRVLLTGLDGNTAYRFRIVHRESRESIRISGQWLGLQLKELRMQGNYGEVKIDEVLLANQSSIRGGAIVSVDSGSAMISWENEQFLYGAVEVQELEGIETTDRVPMLESDSKSVHPELRDSTELTIDACYQCHPESTLGTSHPVRLYGGRDVMIPDDLPTVDGMLTCVTCHDPHGAEGQMLVRETIKTKLCVACHTKFKNSSPSTMFN